MFDLVECEEETEDGDVDFTVSIVPKKWIKDGRCYFPLCSAAKTAKSVKCSEPPDFDLWKSYPARSLGSYDTFAGARSMLSKSEYTSDLDTPTSSKRPNILPQRFSLEVSPMKRTKLTFRPKSLIGQSGVDEPEESPLNNVDAAGFFCDLPVPPPLNPVLSAKDDSLENFEITNPEEGIILVVRETNTATTQTDGTSFNSSSEFEQFVVRQMHKLETNQQQILKILDEVMSTRSVGQNLAAGENTNMEHFDFGLPRPTVESLVELEHFDFGLPRPTVESLVELESLLDNNSGDKEELVKLLVTYGGSNLTQTVKLILDRLMLDSVASLYSNKGLGGKLSFSGLSNINSSIFEACRKNKRFKESVTWSDYETAIIGALKNAADRVRQRQRKANLSWSSSQGGPLGSTQDGQPGSTQAD